MAVESPTDRNNFLNPDEFGVEIVYESNTIRAIWLTESDDFSPGDVRITANRPACLVRTTDVPTLDDGGTPKGLKTLTYAGDTWYITRWLHDGTGMTTLYLELAG